MREPYLGWDAWRMRRGDLELVLVPRVGGRLMNVIWRGRELFWVHPELAGQVEDVRIHADVAMRKRALGFVLWGGEKTWLAPQTAWRDELPFLDLDSGPYDLEETAGEVTMVSRSCRESSIEITRSVAFGPDPTGFTVTHRLRNRGTTPARWAPWSVAMVRSPGRVYLPTAPSSRFPEGVKTFETQPGSVEARPTVVSVANGIATIDCTGSGPFKFGVDPGEGWMLGVMPHGVTAYVGLVTEVAAHPDQTYAHDAIAEVYNSDVHRYFEMEVHGPVTRLDPGSTTTLVQTSRLVDLTRFPLHPDEVRRIAGR